MKWSSRLKWFLIASIAIPMVTFAVPVQAATTAEITVIAVGYVCGAPGGLTLTYITDYEVGITWIKGADAENTMIRAAIGRYPEGIDDGWLVYYGDGTNCSDTGVSLDETAVPTYYRAWSQNAGGIWNEYGYAEDNIEGIGVQLIAFIILAVGMTVAGYALKRTPLCIGAGGAWVVMAFYSMGKSASSSVMEITDIYMALFWIGMAMVLVCMLEPAMESRKRAAAAGGADEEYESEEDLGVKEFTKVRTDIESIKSQLRAGRPRSRRKLSKFNRTGQID
jgi:hypothetical protein